MDIISQLEGRIDLETFNVFCTLVSLGSVADYHLDEIRVYISQFENRVLTRSAITNLNNLLQITNFCSIGNTGYNMIIYDVPEIGDVYTSSGEAIDAAHISYVVCQIKNPQSVLKVGKSTYIALFTAQEDAVHTAKMLDGTHIDRTKIHVQSVQSIRPDEYIPKNLSLLCFMFILFICSALIKPSPSLYYNNYNKEIYNDKLLPSNSNSIWVIQ